MKEQILDTLASIHLGYEDEHQFIRREREKGAPWSESSVLVPLSPFDPEGRGEGRWHFLLNKRSQAVSQPGDLCFPGGHPSPRLDNFIAGFFLSRAFRMGRSPAMAAVRNRADEEVRLLRFFLAGALRECWEEMRVSPAAFDFLGGFPCHRLLLRKKTIYPLVVAANQPLFPRKNREIEEIIRLPVSDFLDEENHGTYTLQLTGKYRDMAGQDHWDVPCFLIRRKNRPDEVLWGATLRIVSGLMEAVAGFVPPSDGPVRVTAALYPKRA